ncbi:MAG: DUF3179 domain-containing protein [Candidatus Methylomirabilales bacterium]
MVAKVFLLLVTLGMTFPAFSDPAFGFSLKINLEKALVPLEEIRAGGPPPDGIPAIDRPKFVSVEEAKTWLGDQEPVLTFIRGGDARAYPLQILIWHEIVNDTVGGVPVAITYCPLCNSALVFDRRIGGEVYDFGTSGMLYKSDLVMYDRKTHSLWAQMEGKAIVGELAGLTLQVLPSGIVSFGAWRRAFPHGKVLSRETGHPRPYGRNPYVGYDRPDGTPFLFFGSLDQRLPPMERVVALSFSNEEKAYPFSLLKQRKVVADRIGGLEVVIFYREGTTSALDQPEIATSRDVGATGVFSPILEGQRLTFTFNEGAFIDRETGSRWNILGQAIAGKLRGKTLERLPHVDAFWFAWAAFKPKTAIYGAK